MANQVFGNLKRAEFEAWLTDLYPVKYGGSESYALISLSDAKERVKSLVSEGKYDMAGALTEQLLRPIKLTSEAKSKSLRVPFPNYAKLVQEALAEGTTLKDVLKRRILADLEAPIAALSSRKDVDKDRLSSLEISMRDWSSKSERESSGNRSYFPSFHVIGEVPLGFLAAMLVEQEISANSGIIAREKLEEVFKSARCKEPIAPFSVEISREANSPWLTVAFSFSTDFVIEQPVVATFNHDTETIAKLTSLFEVRGDSFIHTGKITVLSATLEVNDRYLLVEHLPVLEADVDEPERLNWGDVLAWQLAGVAKISPLQMMLLGLLVKPLDETLLDQLMMSNLRKTLDETKIPIESKTRILVKLGTVLNQMLAQDKKFRDEVLDAVDKNDFVSVSILTRKLESLQRERDVSRFALKTVLDLVKGSQVVSIRAPDMLIRAWEAYGDVNLGPSWIQARRR